MSNLTKRTIPFIIMLVSMIIMMIDYYVTIPVVNTTGLVLQQWAVLVFTFATGVGAIIALRIHGLKIIKREKDWYLSAWLLILMVLFIVVGIGFGRNSETFIWIYNSVYTPLNATTFSILAFYVTTAAFRAFRARNLDAVVLLISGFLVVFGNTSAVASLSPIFGNMKTWIMSVPVASATRVIIIGGALGMISLALRMILGKEVGYLGGAREEE